MFFLSPEVTRFFNVFLSPEINFFFWKSATIQCARWAEKTHVLFGNALHKSNARAHLRKKP